MDKYHEKYILLAESLKLAKILRSFAGQRSRSSDTSTGSDDGLGDDAVQPEDTATAAATPAASSPALGPADVHYMTLAAINVKKVVELCPSLVPPLPRASLPHRGSTRAPSAHGMEGAPVWCPSLASSAGAATAPSSRLFRRWSDARAACRTSLKRFAATTCATARWNACCARA